MKKKWIAMLLTAAMVMGLAGCSTGDTGSGDEGSSGDAQGNSGETEDVSLTVWSPSEDQDPEYGEWLNTMCEQFASEHPEWNIKFTYGVCSESDVKTLVPQDVDAAADVFVYSSTGLENLCQANCLAEFGGSYLDTINEEYPESLVDTLMYDGGVYGVPITTNTFFMYYDKSVFSEDDVTSLEAMLQKGKVAIPLTDGFYMSAFYLGAGCTFFGEDGTDRDAGIVLDTDNAVAMTNYLVDLVANDNRVVASPDEAIAMMREGTVNAYWCGTWQAAQTEEILGDNFGVTPLPTVTVDGEKMQLRPFSSSKAIGVKSTTEYPEAAIALAMYLGGYDSQKLHYEVRNYVPCQKELLASEEIQKDAVVMCDSYTIENIAVPRSNYTEMAYFWTPAESFGTELRDGVITHDNAEAKTMAFNESANSSGVE